MTQQIEVVKARPGVSADKLREMLKYGESLIGNDYLKRMKETGLVADVSFVFENDSGVYLISYYLYPGERQKPSEPLRSIPSLKQYLDQIDPLLEPSTQGRISASNSFWTDANIREQLG